jgi:hypothetical protein
MTLSGFLSRFQMLPELLEIVIRSLTIGVFCRQKKYRKYHGEFNALLRDRDSSKGFSVTEEEAYTLYSSIKAVSKIQGAIAEFGVYKGSTSKLICQVKGDKPLYLFDTFEGMPNEKITEKDRWRENTHRNTTLKEVREYLADFDNVVFVPGVFPDSASLVPALSEVKYSFVNIDVDLYESTIQALQYFYPKLMIGGRLVSHNYGLKFSDGGDTPGVKDAFSDYFANAPDMIVEIAETQCMVIKRSRDGNS